MVEQNWQRSTIYADAVKNGMEISWIMREGEGYTGYAVVKLTGDTTYRVVTRDQLRLLLNPLSGLEKQNG